MSSEPPHGPAGAAHGHTHTHADTAGAADAAAKAAPLYRGYPARNITVGRVYHGLGVDIPAPGQPMMQRLKEVFAQPFVGITTDGHKREGLHALQATGVGNAGAVAAARAYLASLRRRDFARLASQPLDSADRLRWINAFPDWMPAGLYLADLEAAEREAAFKVIEASLSARGFDQTRAAMKVNQALGEFINHSGDSIAEFGYFFTIFGDPSASAPWGWRLMGYHLVLYCTFVGDQMVLTPAFVGAEMAVVDAGPYAGVSVLQQEQQRGLELAASLTGAQRSRAVLHPSMLKKDLPPALSGLDGRHLGGSGQDNRIIPYEGISADALSAGQRERLLQLIELYVARMPDAHSARKMHEVRQQFAETRFAWIGDPEKAPFYYRIHNPVILIEFDHHSGVFLANSEPEPFHIHTIVRTPNGNDYGMDLLRQHYALFPH
jgi:Protein of unknown function (DUF3500)